MTATERNELAIVLAESLQMVPGDSVARLALADMLEEDGYSGAASVQRILAEVGCQETWEDDHDEMIATVAGECPEEEVEERFPEIHVTEEWCPEICAYTAQVRWETDSDEEYVICSEVGDLAAAPLRQRCEWVPWWPR